MSIPYSDEYEIPSASTMKNLCQRSDDPVLFIEAANNLFAIVTSVLGIVFLVPLVIAAPVGIIFSTTFWNGDLLALEAWLSSAMISAVSVAAVVVALAACTRVYTRSLFGAPAYESELQVDLALEDACKLVRSYLKAESVDETSHADRSERRQTGRMGEGRFSNTYLEISTVELDDDRTLLVFRGATIVHLNAILINPFFTDLGRSRERVLTSMEVLKPYASRKKRRSAGHQPSKQAMPAVSIVDHAAPPPSWSKKTRSQHEYILANPRHLKACS